MTKIRNLYPITIAFFFWMMVVPVTCMAQTKQSVDSLLLLIDEAIDNPTPYISKREGRIGQLKYQLKKAKMLEEQYNLSFKLYEEYTPFISDSSIYFLNRCVELGNKLNRPTWASKCKILAALRCSNIGMLTEATNILKDIDTQTLDEATWGTYYLANAHVCGEIAYYSRIPSVKKQYGQETLKYQHLMFKFLPSTDDYVYQYHQLEALNTHKSKEALRINDEWLKHVEKDGRTYALATLFRYLTYKQENDTTKMMYWVAESVLSDIKNGVMDQGSMWELANQLMEAKDVDRAYKYITFNSYCTGRFGSRQRLAQIEPLLATITKMYKEENERYNKRQAIALATISLLALLLLLAVGYVSKKRHQLAIAKDNLAKSNSQLSELNKQQKTLNEELKSLNEEISATNTQLAATNKELSDANRVKEEYVGHFMRLYSIYINKLETLRNQVNKRVKTKQYAELYEMTRPNDFKEEELEEFYSNFDSAFLHLFPHFIEEFNALLKPEERIEPTHREQLPTPIRIFALIRLGINDSRKIAEFLHYSVNTIYNYRAQIKKCALSSRDTFEDDVKKIGKF